MATMVRDEKLDEDEFLKERQIALSMWPTGKEVDLEEAVEYHKGLPDHKNFGRVAERLHREGKTVVFPRGGTPVLEQEIELNRTLIEAGCPLLPLTLDSYTRLLRFDKAQRGLEASIESGSAKLNGFPIVTHGVKNTRKVVEATEGALNQRMTNLDKRLATEIAFASGLSAGLTDILQDWAAYEKKSTLGQNIRMCQYNYRLMGYYGERGVNLTLDLDGLLPAGVFPLSVDIAGIVCNALIAARQGVRIIIPWSFLMGYIPQDIAWARLCRRLVREYLDKFGYEDTATPAQFVSQIPLFPYPRDLGWAFGFINYSAMVGAMSKAEAVCVRTVDEGAGIPTKESHAVSYRSAKWIFDVVRQQKLDFLQEEVDAEEKLAEIEVRSLLNKVFEVGDGDVAIGLQKAFDVGYMDTPLSANINIRGQALGVRDMRGACRYLDVGNLAIPDEAKEFHREKIAERERAQGKKLDYHTVVEEFWTFSKGKLIDG
ncbi:MAG: hypothetical protein ABSD38_09995 [Syntrophorhabdales bacterium]|jgi:methylaspartate mutase epsilon subunit